MPTGPAAYYFQPRQRRPTTARSGDGCQCPRTKSPYFLFAPYTLGASFDSVCTTAGSLFIFGVLFYLVWHWLEDFALPLLVGYLVVAWPSVWPVLNSIANGGSDTESYFHPMQEPVVTQHSLI